MLFYNLCAFLPHEQTTMPSPHYARTERTTLKKEKIRRKEMKNTLKYKVMCNNVLQLNQANRLLFKRNF